MYGRPHLWWGPLWGSQNTYSIVVCILASSWHIDTMLYVFNFLITIATRHGYIQYWRTAFSVVLAICSSNSSILQWECDLTVKFTDHIVWDMIVVVPPPIATTANNTSGIGFSVSKYASYLVTIIACWVSACPHAHNHVLCVLMASIWKWPLHACLWFLGSKRGW